MIQTFAFIHVKKVFKIGTWKYEDDLKCMNKESTMNIGL